MIISGCGRCDPKAFGQSRADLRSAAAIPHELVIDVTRNSGSLCSTRLMA